MRRIRFHSTHPSYSLGRKTRLVLASLRVLPYLILLIETLSRKKTEAMPFLNNLFSTSHIIRRWRFPCWLRGSKAKIIEKSRSNLLIGYPNPRPAHSPTSLYKRTHSLYPKAYHRAHICSMEGKDILDSRHATILRR